MDEQIALSGTEEIDDVDADESFFQDVDVLQNHGIVNNVLNSLYLFI